MNNEVSKEKWMDILEFDSKYQISNLGRVRSKDRVVKSSIHPSGYREIKGCIKKLQNNGNGYIQIYVQINNRRIVHYVHRLVASYFIPNIDRKKYVNHINGIKSDNSLNNLEWVTFDENVNHAKENSFYLKGENSPNVKLTENDVIEIRNICANDKFVNKSKLAKKYNISDSTIHKIINRIRWKHLI